MRPVASPRIDDGRASRCRGWPRPLPMARVSCTQALATPVCLGMTRWRTRQWRPGSIPGTSLRLPGAGGGRFGGNGAPGEGWY